MKDIISLFKLLAEPNRLAIFTMLMEDEYCVCDIERFLQLKQANVSKHLMAFRKHGLIEGRRDTQWIHYRLSPKLIDAFPLIYPLIQNTAFYKATQEKLMNFEKNTCKLD